MRASASQAELSRRTGIDPSDVVAVISELESRKLVTRQRDPDDARRNVITLTRTGRTELARLDAVVADIQDRFLAPLSRIRAGAADPDPDQAGGREWSGLD